MSVTPIAPMPTTDRTAAINEIVRCAGKVTPSLATKDLVTTTQDELYQYETHDVVNNIDSIVYLGLNDDVIWPGNLVKGDRANEFIYEPISVDRGPVTLSISLETTPVTGVSIVQQVDNPKLSTVRQGMADLLKKAFIAKTKVPAKVEFTSQQIYNESQMNLFVGADASYGAGSLKTRFDWNSTTKKNKIIAKYRQIYYSIDIDIPKSPADFFAPLATVSEIAGALPERSMPLYIAGVSYGMMALMFIETDYTEDAMKASLEAEYKGLLDVKLTSGISTKQVMQNSNIQIVVYGGSTAGLKDLYTGYDGFKEVIRTSTDFTADSPGVPLVYKFRHLADNTLAQVSLTSQYNLKKPLRPKHEVKLTIDKFVCTMSDDEGSKNKVDMDRFWVKVNAFDRRGSEKPVQNNPVDELVYNWGTKGEETMGVGAVHPAGTSTVLGFDTVNSDFDLATIKFQAYGRDYDVTSHNEQGWSSWEITGDKFFNQPDGKTGKHKFILTDNSDFAFDVYVTLELINPPPIKPTVTH